MVEMTDDDKPTNRVIIEFRPPTRKDKGYIRDRLIHLISEIKILPRYNGGLNATLNYEIEVVLPEGCIFKGKWWERRIKVDD